MSYEHPAISVIVPMYNVEKYVKFCLESIFSQTFTDYEIILVDDASTDSTYELCQTLCRRKESVTLLKNLENKGQCFCRNRGIREAKGKYVYFMDSDDELLPEALAILYNKAEKENADIVHTNMYFEVFAEGRMGTRFSLWELKGGTDIAEGFLTGTKVERLQLQAQKKMPMPWLKLIRKDVLRRENIIFYDLKISEDDIFSIELSLKVKRFLCINEPIYLYRRYYDEKERVIKRLPQAIPLMAKVMEAYDSLFAQFTFAEIPYSVRMDAMSGWLMAHLNFWIYDILDTSKQGDFIALRKTIGDVTPKNCLQAWLLPVLIHYIEKDSSIKIIARNNRDRERKRLEKYLADAEINEWGIDYPRIYSLAKRMTLLEGYEEKFYLGAYNYLAKSAFSLGRYKEAWEAYGKAIECALHVGESEEELLAERSKLLPYLESSAGMFEAFEKTVAMKILSQHSVEKVVLGIIAPYHSLTDNMLCVWQNLMEQLPKAILMIVSDEFRSKSMLVEAAERLISLGFDPVRTRFETIESFSYQKIDIFLDTYPVSQWAGLKEALSNGVPAVSLWNEIKESKGGKEILEKVGLVDLASHRPEEYLAKAISLASDLNFLHLLQSNLPQMVGKVECIRFNRYKFDGSRGDNPCLLFQHV